MMLAQFKRQRRAKPAGGNLLPALLAAGLLFTATACASRTAPPASSEGSSLQEDVVRQYESVVVDILVNGDGCYNLMGDVQIRYGESGVESVFVEEPALLAFSVSSEHQGGVWLLDLEEGEALLSSLEEIQASLSQQGNTGLAGELGEVIRQLETAGPITGAST